MQMQQKGRCRGRPRHMSHFVYCLLHTVVWASQLKLRCMHAALHISMQLVWLIFFMVVWGSG